jgi:hypothetical protein
MGCVKFEKVQSTQDLSGENMHHILPFQIMVAAFPGIPTHSSSIRSSIVPNGIRNRPNQLIYNRLQFQDFE